MGMHFQFVNLSEDKDSFIIKLSAWVSPRIGKDYCIGEVIIPYWSIIHASPYDKWYILYPVSSVVIIVNFLKHEVRQAI